jgi:hypothetical protein
VINKTPQKTTGKKLICKNLLFIYCSKDVLAATPIDKERVLSIATTVH